MNYLYCENTNYNISLTLHNIVLHFWLIWSLGVNCSSLLNSAVIYKANITMLHDMLFLARQKHCSGFSKISIPSISKCHNIKFWFALSLVLFNHYNSINQVNKTCCEETTQTWRSSSNSPSFDAAIHSLSWVMAKSKNVPYHFLFNPVFNKQVPHFNWSTHHCALKRT